MIYDTFIFNKDFTVLDIRLHELYNVVDKFVIVESDTTFQGASKPFYFKEAESQYEYFMNKIIWVGHEMPPLSDPWQRETSQRNAIGLGLTNAKDSDIIMVSDCDEVPRATVVQSLNPMEITALKMDEYYYSLNMHNDYYGLTRACYYRDWIGGQNTRRYWRPGMPEVENAGWHFSYLFNPEGISEKIKSFAHFELNTPQYTDVDAIVSRIASGTDLYDRKQLERREIDDTYPLYVRENMDRFQEFVC